jgi:hypothetical protein
MRDLRSSVINFKLIFTLIFTQICIHNYLKLFIKKNFEKNWVGLALKRSTHMLIENTPNLKKNVV